MYARARRQYRLGAYRKLGSCETQFIAFEPITQDVSQLPRPLFDSGRNVTRVCVHMHACVRGVPRVCVCMHACVDWYGLEMVGTYVRTYVRRRRPWGARQNMRVRIPSYYYAHAHKRLCTRLSINDIPDYVYTA